MLDIDVSGEQEDRYELRPTDALLAIPATLQDSLMARLDQLGPAKSIAQVAGAIGREFGYDLLEAVAQIGPARLREGLAALESSGLVYADSRLGLPSYAFKHALVQEAAYYSSLRSRRRDLHERIAEALETRSQTARDAPELVAHHWTEAGRIERASPAGSPRDGAQVSARNIAKRSATFGAGCNSSPGSRTLRCSVSRSSSSCLRLRPR